MAVQQRVAIVTGGSRGIGAAICARLAGDGLAVVINYAGSAEAAGQGVQRILDSGGHAIAVQGDVADPTAVKNLFDEAERAFGGIDVLVNNAAIMRLGSIAESDDSIFDTQIATNLKGSFNTLREAARRMRDGGRIINFSTSVTLGCATTGASSD